MPKIIRTCIAASATVAVAALIALGGMPAHSSAAPACSDGIGWDCTNVIAASTPGTGNNGSPFALTSAATSTPSASRNGIGWD